MGLFRKSLKMGYRGRRKSLKRLTAPKSWMLDKTGGTFAPKSSAFAPKSRDSFPMTLFLRNRLKYALSYQEVKKIVMQRLIKVDIASGKMKEFIKFDTGSFDIVHIKDALGHTFATR